MNICFLTSNSLNEYAGGIDSVCIQLMNRFLLDGHKVVHCYSYQLRDASSHAPCTEYCLPNLNIVSDSNIDFLVQVFCNEKIDVVIDETFLMAYHELCVQVKKYCSFKLIYSYHGDPFFPIYSLLDDFQTIIYEPNNIVSKFFKRVFHIVKFPVSIVLRYWGIRRKFSKYASEVDALVFLSDIYSNRISKILNNKYNNIYYITNPIALSKIPPKTKKNQIVYVGRLVRQKRVDRLLKIWKIMEQTDQSAQLVIVGYGEEREFLITMARTLQLRNIHFMEPSHAKEAISTSKALVIVSTYEGMGLVAFEAIAYGAVPVFYDSLRCLRTYIQNDFTGVLIPSFSIKQYAHALLQLLQNEEYRHQITENAYSLLKTMDITVVASKWYSLFSQLQDGK